MVKRQRRMGRVLRFRLSLALGIVVLLAIAVFVFLPTLVDIRLNSTRNLSFAPLTASTQSFHQSLTIADLHADSLLWGRNLATRSGRGHVDIPRLIQGNVALQVFTVVTKVPTPLLLEGNGDRTDSIIKLAVLQRWPIPTWFSLKQRALYQARQLQKVEDKVSNSFSIIKTRSELQRYLDQRASRQPMTAGILGIEGAQVLEGELNNLDQLYNAGFRLIGLAHFFDTEVSGSAHGLAQGGLTPLGRQVIQRVDELGMIVDLAHASSGTIDEVLAMSDRPVIVSHTGVKGTCDNQRNLSDRQLQQVTEAGGVIGIGFWPVAVCGEAIRDIVRAIRYTVDQVGIDHVALGSDFDGAVRMPIDAAQMIHLTHALEQDGFSASDIRQIMGLNVIWLFQHALPAQLEES